MDGDGQIQRTTAKWMPGRPQGISAANREAGLSGPEDKDDHSCEHSIPANSASLRL